jgi:hypothetical protein
MDSEDTCHPDPQRGSLASPDILRGVPPLRGQLSTLGVINWGMEDGDAYIPCLCEEERAQVSPSSWALNASVQQGHKAQGAVWEAGMHEGMYLLRRMCKKACVWEENVRQMR